jgi:hypothetical protein
MNVHDAWSTEGTWSESWTQEVLKGTASVLQSTGGKGRVTRVGAGGESAIYWSGSTTSWSECEQTVLLSVSASSVKGGLVARHHNNTYYGCAVGSSNSNRLHIFKVVRGVYTTLSTIYVSPLSQLTPGIEVQLTLKVIDTVMGTKLDARIHHPNGTFIALSVEDADPSLQRPGSVGLWVQTGGQGTKYVYFDDYQGPELPPTVRLWSDPSSWPNGQLPVPESDVTVSGTEPLVLDTSIQVNSLTIQEEATLILSEENSVSLQSKGNIIVHGLLQITPANADVNHQIQITGAVESNFVGGGMMPLDSDPGLWVMGAGRLNIEGTKRTPWIRVDSDVVAGSNTLHLSKEPVGWRVGDELMVTPTSSIANPDKELNPTFNSWGHHELRFIQTIEGQTITVSSPFTFAHPLVEVEPNRFFGAEVANLTRNVRIEGMPPAINYPRTTLPPSGLPGRSHIFIHNTVPVAQRVKGVAIRYMGPRKAVGPNDSTFVLGRYGFHFHHCMDNSRDVFIKDVVVRDCGSHSFVPHSSHGTMWCECIAYNVTETPFWWDPEGSEHDRRTDDTMIQRCLVAQVKFDGASPALNGYLLGMGKGNSLIDSVACGVQGTSTAAGFRWPSSSNGDPHNTWTFTGNVAHNNKRHGVRAWQNDKNIHEISNFVAYHNFASGIDHGAYRNAYFWHDVCLYGNGLLGGPSWIQHSNSLLDFGITGRAEMRDIRVDGAGITQSVMLIPRHGMPPHTPVLFIGWSVKEYKTTVVVVNEDKDLGDGQPVYGHYDFVDWSVGVEERDLLPSDFTIIRMNQGSRIRVQGQAQCFQIDASPEGSGVVTFIPPFYSP